MKPLLFDILKKMSILFHFLNVNLHRKFKLYHAKIVQTGWFLVTNFISLINFKLIDFSDFSNLISGKQLIRRLSARGGVV